MNNQIFVKSLNIPTENQQRCLEAMEKYGDNHWWESDTDPRKYAYYQMLEPIMLGNFSHFHESLELLLGRPVWTHEMGISADKLRKEAERAWTYQVGVTSEIEKQERITEVFDDLGQWAKEHGKEVVQINLPEERK